MWGLPGVLSLSMGLPGHAAPPTPRPTPGASAATPRARFDIVRVAPDGQALIAGHAPPFATVEVSLDGHRLGTARADGSGSWLLLPRRRLHQGALALAVRILPAPGGASARAGGTGSGNAPQPVPRP